MSSGAKLRKKEAYLQGISLFNSGKYYGAHEAWESIWLHCPKESIERTFLGGLIQLSAHYLKAEQNQPKPAGRLLKEALAKLTKVAKKDPNYAGMDLKEILSKLDSRLRGNDNRIKL